MRDFKEAGINVWILTGDKEETAVNIGYASGILDNSTHRIFITSLDPNKILSEINEAQNSLDKAIKNGLDSVMVISGDSLLKIQMNDKLKKLFLKVGSKCQSVIACRMSPK